MSKPWIMRTAAAFFMCLALVVVSTGQETTGSIVGNVKDSAGGSIAGAIVTASIPSQGNRAIRTVTTNEDGVFSIPNIPVSVYSVTVEAPNFKKYVANDVKVDIGQRRSVDVVLEAGNIQETVTVDASTLGAEVSIPQVSTTITSTQATELSINNRNWVQLITLAPGVTDNLADLVPVGNFSPDGSPNIMAISVNGARQSQNTYTVDGADITDRGANITIQAAPSLDSIGEFKVLRALYPAESGRSGGGQINVVTKSGTDEFHGSLYAFVRNDIFNANNFFINRSPVNGIDSDGKAKKTPFRYNNYGFTVGGPVWFLNFGERDPDEPFFAKVPKTYFFFSEEQRKDRRYLLFPNSNVPTAGMRQGVFQNPVCLSGTIISGVSTCNQFLPAGTPITSVATLDPASVAYLQNIYSKMPLPDSSGTLLTASTASSKFDFRQEIIKFDTSLTKDWTASYRYGRDTVPTFAARGVNGTFCNVPELCPVTTDAPGRTHTFQSTYVFSPNLILEGRYSHVYGGIFVTQEGLYAQRNSPISIVKPYDSGDSRVPNHSGFTILSNIQGFGDWNNYSVKDDYSANMTWIANGKHTLKFGGTFSKYLKNEDQLGGAPNGNFSSFSNTPAGVGTRGTVCVNAAGTAITCPTSTSANALQLTEQQFANFLIGRNVVFSQNKFNLTARFHQTNYEAYAQDEFRMTPRLTMYLGVRYSYFGPPWDENGLLSNFVPELWSASQAPTVTLTTAGDSRRLSGTGNMCNGLIVNAQNYRSYPECTPTISPYGKYVYETPKNNFAPRFGLAWDVFGQGKTILRTGYGIYHDQVLLGNVELQLQNPIFQETISLTGGTLSNPIPPGTVISTAASLGVPALIRGVPTDYKNPYMQHWSFDIQQLVGRKTFFQIGYYGSKGTHLIGANDINNLPPGYALTQTCILTANAAGAALTTGPCQATDPVTNQPIAFNATGNANVQRRLDQIRPYRGYRAITMVEPKYNSNYHSMQFQATQRLTGDSQVQASYTWSKNLTDNQTDRSTGAQDIYNVRAEYGRAQLDRRHVFRLNYIYELPFFRSQEGFVGKVLGGWQLSGITSYQSGLPLTLTIGAGLYDPAGLGFFGSSPSGARPDLLCDPNANAPQTLEQWFNITCVQTTFPVSGPAVPGNSPRGAIDGPTLFKSDVTLTKNILFGERYKLQLKAESFNVFNQTNFTSPSTVASTARVTNSAGLISGFGVISGARDPRTFQFGAKFSF